MKDTKRNGAIGGLAYRGEFGRASSRGSPVDHRRNCQISLTELRNVERKRAQSAVIYGRF